MTSFNGILKGATGGGVWGTMYIYLDGVADFDKYVFDQISLGELTPSQASYLWEYTDGYRFTITSNL